MRKIMIIFNNHSYAIASVVVVAILVLTCLTFFYNPVIKNNKDVVSKPKDIYYNIVFKYNNEQLEIVKKVKKGDQVNEPDRPVLDGYNFLGWYKDDTIYNFNSAVSSTFTLVAKYEIINKDENVSNSDVHQNINYNEKPNSSNNDINSPIQGTDNNLSQPLPDDKKTDVIFSDDCVKKGNVCTNNQIKNGISVGVKINDTEYKFHVIANDEDNIELLMDNNLGPSIPWISSLDYKKYASGSSPDSNISLNSQLCTGYYGACNYLGPITALLHLQSLTEQWLNIPDINYYGYYDNGSKSISVVSGSLTVFFNDNRSTTINNIKARLATYEEVNNLCIDGTCPCFLYDHLDGNMNDCPNNVIDTNQKGYWLLTAGRGGIDLARFMSGYGYIDETSVITADLYGLRPVIKMAKEN